MTIRMLALALIGTFPATSTYFGGTTDVGAESMSHTFTLRNDCRKISSGGCTAKGKQCANAPAGHYFAPQEVAGVVTNSLSPGRSPLCRTAKTTGNGVVVNGLLAPTSMCARPHAESGSGMGGLNQVYFVNCEYTATIYALPQ